MKTLLFGSIGTLVETSELQRAAFNKAFREAGLDWEWTREEYRAMLADEGGRARIVSYAAERGEAVDASALHRDKSRHFRAMLDQGSLRSRPGVADTVAAAREAGVRLGFVSTTSPDNVAHILDAIADEIDAEAFDLVMDATYTTERKPDPDPYLTALRTLGATPLDTLAIEDNEDGVQSAVRAGLACIAFPGANTGAHDYADAVELVTGALEPQAVLSRLDALGTPTPGGAGGTGATSASRRPRRG